MSSTTSHVSLSSLPNKSLRYLNFSTWSSNSSQISGHFWLRIVVFDLEELVLVLRRVQPLNLDTAMTSASLIGGVEQKHIQVLWLDANFELEQ